MARRDEAPLDLLARGGGRRGLRGRGGRESHDRVAERRDVAAPNPARSHAPAVVGHRRPIATAVSQPAIEDHPHTADAGEPPLQILEERGVVWAHDDEQFDIRKRPRRKQLEKPLAVMGTNAVGRRGVVERLALSQVVRLSLALAPRTQHFHLGVKTMRGPCHPEFRIR